VVARVCLDMLRSRKSRREEPFSAHAPEPVASGPRCAGRGQGRALGPLLVLAFTITRGRIVEIDVVADPERLRRLDLAVLDDR